MKVKHTTYLHIKFSQYIVIVKARLYRLTRNRMVLPRNRTRSARRLPVSLEQSHNSTGSALNDPTTQWAPHSKRERRLGTRQRPRAIPLALTKIFRIDRLPFFLTHGALRARPTGARVALLLLLLLFFF